jgi:hypothetical protein
VKRVFFCVLRSLAKFNIANAHSSDFIQYDFARIHSRSAQGTDCQPAKGIIRQCTGLTVPPLEAREQGDHIGFRARGINMEMGGLFESFSRWDTESQQHLAKSGHVETRLRYF